MNQILSLTIMSALALHVGFTQAADSPAAYTVSEEKKELEIGGAFTLDAYGQSDRMSHPQLSIGMVNLGASIGVSKNLVASVLLAAENDMHDIWIDQALADYKSDTKPLELIFGLQSIPHGVLSTHLISSPLIADDVGQTLPSVCIITTKRKIKGGAALAIVHADADSVVGIEESDDIGGVLFCDFLHSDVSFTRLSVFINEANVDADLGTSLVLSKITVDVEAHAKLASGGHDQEYPSGYTIAAAYLHNDNLTLAARTEGRSSAFFKDNEFKTSLGATWAFANGIFIAAEVAHRAGGAEGQYQEIALQGGLQHSLTLPGFQRKTLSNP